jgi:AAA ATPase domain
MAVGTGTNTPTSSGTNAARPPTGAHRQSLAVPAPLSSFVGRERQVADVKRLLADTRLLTLTGPGGVGKTRLALEVARDLDGGGLVADGAWFVGLAPLADAALVPQETAAALGIREEAGRPILETLQDALRPSRLLLVLDNCEHLVEACAELADALLHACPLLTILATSREALNIAGEAVWPVPPLLVPAQANDLVAGRAAASRSGSAVCRARPHRGPSIRAERRERGRSGRGLHAARWAPTGDRARRRARPAAWARPDRRPVGRPVPPADGRRPYGYAAPPDHPRAGGLEL